MKILFVCDGNICRSPVAAAFLNSNLENGNVQVRSAGIYATNNRPILETMRQVLVSHNLPTDHRSQRISPESLGWADLIFTMTRPQKFILISMVPAIANKVYTLQEYIGHPVQDIPVPRNETLEAYQDCAEMLQHSCSTLYRELCRQKL
ncbi:arsenate reductase/protein-tyrosine-phosphatase family protein [Leptothoe kymatousa]|uniref:Low molecular weight protein arginine phosphatase n=1 Tax=Leptothoe kymatousa TAU-MAC 1615 TaxID=2364775 RepID=A0ABS5Y407_9CYAN|nr:hypothetical protein [Leptothoe kymatousa]MBT9311710.1 low molecular weight protein arginine phosphatase [Leptothoe kymatousa TAU-MAC 1615]